MARQGDAYVIGATETETPAPAAKAPIPDDLDLVIAKGRVMDPETKLDAVRNVGIKDGKIVVISEESLEGARTIDATGHVVAPGFIDYLFLAFTNATANLRVDLHHRFRLCIGLGIAAAHDREPRFARTHTTPTPHIYSRARA